jgi:two-component system, OmpR family, response regulator CssR
VLKEKMLRIAIVEDDSNIRQLVESYLIKEGYKTIGLKSAEEAESYRKNDPPDLWILDIMLPGIDGYEFCRRIRKKSEVPIIMISAQDDDINRIMGIEIGSDDYLTKPFNPKELVAHVNRILYRWEMFNKNGTNLIKKIKEVSGQTPIRGLQIFEEEHRVVWNGADIEVSTKEFQFLLYMTQHVNKACSREELIEKVWGFDFLGSERNVDHFVKRMRKKMDGLMIETVWGYGYRLRGNN